MELLDLKKKSKELYKTIRKSNEFKRFLDKCLPSLKKFYMTLSEMPGFMYSEFEQASPPIFKGKSIIVKGKS